MTQLQQLQKALIEGGLVAHLDDDNIMLVGHRSKSITREDILKALHDPEELHNLSLTERDGIVIIYPRRRKQGNTRGPIATDRSKIVRPEIGPALDQEMQDSQDWFMDMSKEARALEIRYRHEDRHRDQQIAPDWSKIVRPEIGPIFVQDVLDWLMSMSKEERAMQWTYRFEDHHRDQQEALGRSMGQ